MRSPNTFSEGDVLSAEKMNENFQYLEQQFRMALATTADCAAGGSAQSLHRESLRLLKHLALRRVLLNLWLQILPPKGFRQPGIHRSILQISYVFSFHQDCGIIQ